jgi:hypothetical protein
MYSKGQGVTLDNKKALELYLKAEKSGCPYAKYNLAERYRTGYKVPKDLKRAKALYKDLAKRGDKPALEKLKLIPSG